MRLANVEGRAVVLTDAGSGYDVAVASEGAFGPGIHDLYDRWESFRNWAASGSPRDSVPVRRSQIGPPSPSPRQGFAVGADFLRQRTVFPGFT